MPPSYESVTIFPGWEDIPQQPVLEQIQALMAKKCVVFLFVHTGQVMQAADFLYKLTEVDHGAYVFKLWCRKTVKKTSKTVCEGPRGCVLSDTVQVWAMQLNRPDVHDVRTMQTVASPRITEVVDHIADHVNTDRRVVVVFGGEEKAPAKVGSTEFDIYSVPEAGIVKKKVFTASSARKSRVLMAYIEAQGSVQLNRDRRMLERPDTDTFTEPEELVRRMVAECQMPSADLAKVLKRTIAKKRRLETQQGKGIKRKRQCANSGIAAVCEISAPLRDFLVEHCSLVVPPEGVPRTEVVKAIPAYVKKHGLSEGRKINVDSNLRALMQGAAEDDEITYFNIYKYINHNFIKAQ
tara:strand:- start:999 stop:2051 length:1053 start_codon:yes stop_codon:yes gene_type:complete